MGADDEDGPLVAVRDGILDADLGASLLAELIDDGAGLADEAADLGGGAEEAEGGVGVRDDDGGRRGLWAALGGAVGEGRDRVGHVEGAFRWRRVEAPFHIRVLSEGERLDVPLPLSFSLFFYSS